MNDFFNNFTNNHFVGALTTDVIFLRLLLAVIFGGIVGIERERENKPAGLRTYILVCFGATVVSMIEDQFRIDVFDASVLGRNFAETMSTDMGRLGAQVISGIGFLGAGCIIKERGEYIGGMTTAAGIWATGCVGLGIGWGFYNIALMAIIFMVFIMVILKKLEDKVAKKLRLVFFEVSLSDSALMYETIKDCQVLFKERNISVVKIEKDLKSKTIFFQISTENPRSLLEIITALSAHEGVISVKESNF